MQPLDDGVYDAFVIDAQNDVEKSFLMHLEITITSGARKGEVVHVGASNMTRETIDVIGLPATLTVTNGQPSVVIDD